VPGKNFEAWRDAQPRLVTCALWPDFRISVYECKIISGRTEKSFTMDQDAQYLKLLAVFHYIVGGLAALCSCIFFIHFGIGVAILTGAIDDAPAFVGLMFVGMATIAITLGWTLAICLIIAGCNLAKRRHYMFCLVMAAIACIFMPFGTVLGVFTIIVLTRPSVKELFESNKDVAPYGTGAS